MEYVNKTQEERQTARQHVRNQIESRVLKAGQKVPTAEIKLEITCDYPVEPDEVEGFINLVVNAHNDLEIQDGVIAEQ